MWPNSSLGFSHCRRIFDGYLLRYKLAMISAWMFLSRCHHTPDQPHKRGPIIPVERLKWDLIAIAHAAHGRITVEARERLRIIKRTGSRSFCSTNTDHSPQAVRTDILQRSIPRRLSRQELSISFTFHTNR